MPMNLFESHWVAVVIDFRAQIMYVLDSLDTGLAGIRKCLRPVKKALPMILSASEYYHHKPKVEGKWKVAKVDKTLVPQQPDKYACGPYACVAIEDIVLRRPTWTLNSARGYAKNSRDYIAEMIYNRSLDWRHDDYDLAIRS